MKLATFKNERSVAFEKTVGDSFVVCAPGATVNLPESLASSLAKLGMVLFVAPIAAAPAPVAPDDFIMSPKSKGKKS